MQLVLEQRQDLKLVMTPQLRQSIELLQYSTYEIDQFLKELAVENPLIELEYDSSGFKDRAVSSDKHSAVQAIDFVKQDVNKRDELYLLAKVTFHDDESIRALRTIIYNLDENGFFLNPNEWLNEEEYERGINQLQKIAPLGLGACDIKHCLSLQIQYTNNDDRALFLVKHHLNDLASKRYNKILQNMNITLDEVLEIEKFLKTLDPRPGSFLNDTPPQYILSDINVEQYNGDFVCTLNDRYLPKITLNSYYMNLTNDCKETSNYISHLYSEYKWLVTSMERRKKTLSIIMEVLLKKQHDFFKFGQSALKPLRLKDVAEEIEMHESTVSRAISNKVISTPVGIFELRSLLSSKLQTIEGEDASRSKVKHLIKTIIKKEDKLKPFSDQKISDFLKKEEGIIISRRTVTKYREELNIPISIQRKQRLS